MNDILFREVNKHDYNDLKVLINDAWHFEKYTNNPNSVKHILNANMHTALLTQNYTQVAELNGEVVGFLYGRVDGRSIPLKNLTHLPYILFHGACLLLKSRHERNLVRGFFNLIKVYTKLLQNTKSEYDGELVFFVVSSKCRGKGIGKQLLNNYLDYCRQNSVKNIYVYTDENCNYGFYDFNGFTPKGRLPVSFDLHSGEFTFDVFIYDREI